MGTVMFAMLLFILVDEGEMFNTGSYSEKGKQGNISKRTISYLLVIKGLCGIDRFTGQRRFYPDQLQSVKVRRL